MSPLRRRSRALGTAPLVGFAIFSITATAPLLSRAASPPETCYQTGHAADEHTCLHGFGGPFANRVALPYPHVGSPLDIQNVDPTHTLYTILLSGASSSERWVVSYQPSTSGSFAFYLKRPGDEGSTESPYPFELRDAFGDSVDVRFEHELLECPEYLSWVKVYDLNAQRYHLVLGAEEGTSVEVAVEHLDSFASAELFVDADSDGHGDPDALLKSWCGAAIGYVTSGHDCDDDDPKVFPNARGECGAYDGCTDAEIPDECSVGGGGATAGAAGAGGINDGSGGDDGGHEAGGAGGMHADAPGSHEGSAGQMTDDAERAAPDAGTAPAGGGCSYPAEGPHSTGYVAWGVLIGVYCALRSRRRHMQLNCTLLKPGISSRHAPESS